MRPPPKEEALPLEGVNPLYSELPVEDNGISNENLEEISVSQRNNVINNGEGEYI